MFCEREAPLGISARAYAHSDDNSFYCSRERVFDARLVIQERNLVTLGDVGIAVSAGKCIYERVEYPIDE